jgi:TorA maturation chaperone TorD
MVAGAPSVVLADATMKVAPISDEDSVRANLYGLLGHLLAGPPDADLLATLGRAVPHAAADTLLNAALGMLAVAAGRSSVEALRDEYQVLFIGLGRGEVVPYGSWYLTGFLMEQPLAALRNDLRRLGIERRDDVHEPEDHAAALCDAMSLLIDSDEPAAVSVQRQFFAQHLEPWLGRFFRDLQQAPSAHFYRAVGQLGEQFIDVETQAFGMSIPAAETVTPGAAG